MVLAYYDQKIFRLHSLTMLDPITVIDIEFLQYSETEVETDSFHLNYKGVPKR
jgi:hypothetical protein